MSRVLCLESNKAQALTAWSGYPLKFSPCLLLFGRHKNGYLWAAFLYRQTGRIQRLHYHSYPLREKPKTFMSSQRPSFPQYFNSLVINIRSISMNFEKTLSTVLLCLGLLVGSCISIPTAKAQVDNKPYYLSWRTDAPILAGNVGVLGLGMYLKQKKPALTPEQIQELDPNKGVPKFERFVQNNWSVPAQKGSDVFLYTAPVLPALLLIDPDFRKNSFKEGAVISIETFLTNTALTYLVKETVKRKRPFVFNPEAPMSKKLAKDATSSFYSGHTSTVAAMSFMTAKMYVDHHPDSNAKPIIWGTAALLPAATAFLRVRGGKHYLTDVLIGLGSGALVGILIPTLHRTGE